MSNATLPPTTLLDLTRVREMVVLMHDGEMDGFEPLIVSLATELSAFYALPPPSDNVGLDVTRRAAHSVKGACLSIGAQALGERFAEIERLARDGNFVELAALSASSRDMSANSILALRNAARKILSTG